MIKVLTRIPRLTPSSPVRRNAHGSVWEVHLSCQFDFPWHGHANHVATKRIDGVNFCLRFKMRALGKPVGVAHPFLRIEALRGAQHRFKRFVKGRIKRVGDRCKHRSIVVERALMTSEIDVLVR